MPGWLLITALLAPPIDWANHDYGFFTLKDGAARMHEYSEPGGLHDTHIWRLKGTRVVNLGGRMLTEVRIHRADHLTNGRSREDTVLLYFAEKTEVGRVIIPTTTAEAVIEGDRIVGRWKVGAERFTLRWRLKGGKIVRDQ